METTATLPATLTPGPLPVAPPNLGDLLGDFLRARSANTRRALEADLRALAGFLGLPSPAAAVRAFLSGGAAQGNGIALRWKAAMAEAGSAPNTARRRLSTLRGLCRLARTMGAISWGVEVAGVRSENVRDCRGVGLGDLRVTMAGLKDRGDAKGARDSAILLLALQLRRSEISGLDLEDLDLAEGQAMVRRKGRTTKKEEPLPTRTIRALRAWIVHRGEEGGPLFFSLDSGHARGRLSPDSVSRVLRAAGERAGVRGLRAHRVRHGAATLALSRGHEARAAAAALGHSTATLQRFYDDADRAALGRAVAEDLAGLL